MKVRKKVFYINLLIDVTQLNSCYKMEKKNVLAGEAFSSAYDFCPLLFLHDIVDYIYCYFSCDMI